MKTKNIFRMLLVAAALLLGANNVMADETFTLWESPNGNTGTEMNWNKIELNNELLQKISKDDVIEFYGTGGENAGWTVAIYTGNNNVILGTTYEYTTNPLSSGVAKYTVTEEQVNRLHDTTYPAVLTGSNVTISRVLVKHFGKSNLVLSFASDEENVKMGETLASPALNNTNVTVTYTSANTNIATVDASTGVVTPVNTGNTIITATFAGDDTYAETTATYKIIVIKGDPNISFTQSTMSVKVGETKDSPTLNNSHNLSVYYFAYNTYPVTVNRSTGAVTGIHVASDVDIHAKFDGDDNWNSSEAIYYLNITDEDQNPTDTRADVTLVFSASTSYATVGEAPTNIPTLTATSNGETVSGLAITYTSSNTSVAQVNTTTGAITLVAAGSTTITASFAGDTNYKPASASYTLTVNAAPQTPTYISVNMGDYECRTYVTTTAIDFSQSVGIKAYYATGLNSEGTGVLFRRVTGIVPASVALLLQKVSGASEYKLLTTETEGSAPTPNKLVPGNDGNVGGSNIYVLTVHNNQLVFAETNINTARVDRVHAYLDLHNTNARRRLAISFDDDSENTTGIDTIEIKEQGIIYNLRGQRVQKPTKGVYIINGKKMIIK